MFYTRQMFRYGDPDALSTVGLPPGDRRLFARFLAAAWRDAGFPLTDHRGSSREPLENWFSDRVRKLFSDRDLLTGDFKLRLSSSQKSSRLQDDEAAIE
jgi:hypothetical protein